MVHHTYHEPVKLFATSSSKHLLRSLAIEKGLFSAKSFQDGELYIKIQENVNGKTVWVMADTSAPAENLLELLFLLDALKHSGAKIKLILNYFGYARQDKPKHGESSSGEVIAKWLQSYHLSKIYVVHMHSERLRHALTYEQIIPFDLFIPHAKRFDAVVAPDRGAQALAQKIAMKAKKPLILIEKHRPAQEQVKILSVIGEVKNQRLLIVDDMIATGNTILAAAKILKSKGAKSIEVMATHGLFVQDALKKLEKSSIRKITVTNSLPQPRSPKLRVVSIAPILQALLRH